MRQGIDGSARSISAWSHIRAILLLPVMNTIFIPTILLSIFRDVRLGQSSVAEDLIAATLGMPVLALGIFLVVRAIALFVRRGRGTLAPWDPTEALITCDIYRYSRNPMKAGLFLVLIGECLLLRSVALTIWAAVFIAVNIAYIRWFEEKGLTRRFGSRYRDYCREVPRWLRPRPRPDHAVDSIERAS